MAKRVWLCCGTEWGRPHLQNCPRINPPNPLKAYQQIGKPLAEELGPGPCPKGHTGPAGPIGITGHPFRDEDNRCIDCGFNIGHADDCFYAPFHAGYRPLDIHVTSHSPELTKPADGPKTLLDEIAIAAMQGMLAAGEKSGTAEMTTNERSKYAYYQAKSMLAARARFGK
jgi:hypothetical protein